MSVAKERVTLSFLSDDNQPPIPLMSFRMPKGEIAELYRAGRALCQAWAGLLLPASSANRNWDSQTAILGWRATFSIARPSTRHGRIRCKLAFRAFARIPLGPDRLATSFFDDFRLPDRRQPEPSLSLPGLFPHRYSLYPVKHGRATPGSC
jgi:hypothetical protein